MRNVVIVYGYSKKRCANTDRCGQQKIVAVVLMELLVPQKKMIVGVE